MLIKLGYQMSHLSIYVVRDMFDRVEETTKVTVYSNQPEVGIICKWFKPWKTIFTRTLLLF